MPFRAMRSVGERVKRNGATMVLIVRHRLKMRGVDADLVAAKVVKLEPVGDFADGPGVCEAMGKDGNAART